MDLMILDIRRPLAFFEGEAKRVAKTTVRFAGGWCFAYSLCVIAEKKWCLTVFLLIPVLGVSGLGCVAFSVYVLGPVSSPLGVSGFQTCHLQPCGGGFFAMFASGFRWCLAVLSPSPGGCRSGRVRARLRRVFCLRAGACFFSFRGFRLVTLGVSDLSLRNPAGEGFLLCLRPDLGGVWLFWVHRRVVAALGVSGLGCVAFSVYVLGPVSSPLGVSDLSLRNPAGEGFLLCLRPDLGGVWLFWVHRRVVATLGVSGLGCVAFSVYVLGPVSSPLGVSDLSLRNPAGEGFLLCLRPDLGGVWLFWVHRRVVAALGVSGLGCVAFSVYVLGPVSSPLGVSDLSLRNPAGEGFLLCLRPDLGGVWLFWVHRRVVAALGVSGLGCVAFSVYVLGPVSSPLGVSDLSLRNPAGEGFLLCLRPDLGGVWLFWVHRRVVAALGVSGLGCVAFSVYVLGPVSSPLGVSDLSLRNPAGEGFLLCLRPDLGGVWLFWVHRREVAALGVSGLGCVAFSVYVLGPVSSPLGVSDLSLRNPAGEGFLLCLRPDLGGVWLFWVHRREVAVLGVSGLAQLRGRRHGR